LSAFCIGNSLPEAMKSSFKGHSSSRPLSNGTEEVALMWLPVAPLFAKASGWLDDFCYIVPWLDDAA
jgi:hypothetical protein